MNMTALIFIQILLGHVVFGNLARANFPFIGIVSPFHSGHYTSFESISLFEQLTDAFRIRALNLG